MNKIILETMEDTIIEGEVITTIELNRIARNSCQGLTYLMNIMDGRNNSNDVYMWFKNDRTGISYLVMIQ